MDNTYWHKQADKPLFPDLIWARPENKRQAGKLLIIGGNKFGFAAVGSAYTAAQKAGAGHIRVLMPDALAKTVSKLLPEAEFAPSTPSGSFSRQSLGTFMELAQWTDGVLLAGDFGRNSETAVVLERFLQDYKGQVTLQQDSLDYFWRPEHPLIERPKTNMVINLGKLQKYAKNNWPGTPVLHSMSLKDLVDWLHERTRDSSVSVITKHAEQLLAARKGEVVSNPTKDEINWQTELGAYISVWQIQQPSKPFSALVSAVYDFAKI